MFKLSLEEIKIVLEWYSIAEHELLAGNEEDIQLMRRLIRFIEPYTDTVKESIEENLVINNGEGLPL